MRRYPSESSALPCRFLPDRLGVLLHGSGGSGCHAAVHMAVLFRREEAETVSVLTKEIIRETETGRRRPPAVRPQGEDSESVD